jgi:hypothetical protein
MSGVVVETPHANRDTLCQCERTEPPCTEKPRKWAEAMQARRSHGNDARVFQTDETDGGVAIRMSGTLLIHLRHLRHLKKEGR